MNPLRNLIFGECGEHDEVLKDVVVPKPVPPMFVA
jgi:hypothetical protein